MPEPELDTAVTGELTMTGNKPSCCEGDILPFSNYLEQLEATDPSVAHAATYAWKLGSAENVSPQ